MTVDPAKVLELTLFLDLNQEEIEELSTVLSAREVEAGSILFAEGESGEELYFVLSGELRISCRGPGGSHVVVGYAHAGEIVGEMAVLEPSPRSASVTAVETSELLCLPTEGFLELVNDGHPLASRLLEHLRILVCGRLRELDARVDSALRDPTASQDIATLSMRVRDLWRALWQPSSKEWV